MDALQLPVVKEGVPVAERRASLCKDLVGLAAMAAPLDDLLVAARQERVNPRIEAEQFLEADRSRLLGLLRDRGTGSVLRGWRRELDPEGALEITSKTFVLAVVHLGIAVDCLGLCSLDEVPQSLALEELAPSEGALVRRFREWVKETYNGPAAMFHSWDRQNSGKIFREGFFANCRDLNLDVGPAEMEELFCFLDTEDVGEITREDVLVLEANPLLRDMEMFNVKIRSMHQRQRLLALVYLDEERKTTVPTNRRAHRPWLAAAFEKLPILVCQKRLEQKRIKHHRRTEAYNAFLRHIRSTFGTEIRGWRRGLDPGNRFEVDRTSLRRYCRRADLAIDFVSLWSCLDRDGDNTVTMEELDPHSAHVLAATRNWARRRYGSCAALWDLPLVQDLRHTPQMEGRWVSDKKMILSSFTNALKAAGWPGASEGWEAAIGLSLDLYGCGFVELSDLEWLDAWEPPDWLHAEPDREAWAEFRALILRYYGQPLRAWRQLMDADNNNEVCWSEFVQAARKVAFDGNIGGAWRCLDADVSGAISLKEYDPVSAEILSSFKNLSEQHYGSVELAFKAFDTDGDGCLTPQELRRACRRLNWSGEVRDLINCLGIITNTEGGKGVTLLDIQFLDTWVEDSPSHEAHEASTQHSAFEPPTLQRAASAAALLTSRSASSAKERPSSKRSLIRRCVAAGGLEAAGATTAISWGPASIADIGETSASAASPRALPKTPAEHLYRTYHCLSAASLSKSKPRAGRHSLPWLDRLERLDLRSAVGPGILAAPWRRMPGLPTAATT